MELHIEDQCVQLWKRIASDNYWYELINDFHSSFFLDFSVNPLLGHRVSYVSL